MFQISSVDRKIIFFLRKISIPFTRISLFIVFFWFGALKVVGQSPANPLVAKLLAQTLPFVGFEQFIIFFGIFEMLIGVLFVWPGLERLVMPLLLLHMASTSMPLFLLPQMTWSAPFVPTLEGQYIVKNLVIIATAIGVAAHIHPFKYKR